MSNLRISFCIFLKKILEFDVKMEQKIFINRIWSK